MRVSAASSPKRRGTNSVAHPFVECLTIGPKGEHLSAKFFDDHPWAFAPEAISWSEGETCFGPVHLTKIETHPSMVEFCGLSLSWTEADWDFARVLEHQESVAKDMLLKSIERRERPELPATPSGLFGQEAEGTAWQLAVLRLGRRIAFAQLVVDRITHADALGLWEALITSPHAT